MSSLRLEKVNELIREELGTILSSETHLKQGVFITITFVRTTPDLKTAHVGISVFPENEGGYGFASINTCLYKLQGILNRRLSLRPLPRIVFEKDETEHRAQRVEDALQTIRKEREAENVL